MTSYSVVDLKCTGCGAVIAVNQNVCKFCGNPVVVTSFKSIDEEAIKKHDTVCHADSQDKIDDSEINIDIAVCHLRAKAYDEAQKCFEILMKKEKENSEVYFYAAASLLKGKKAFITPKVIVDKAIEYIKIASNIENRGIYHYFLAYLKYDYYERKYLDIKPNFKEELNQANKYYVTENDIRTLFELLNVSKPNVF